MTRSEIEQAYPDCPDAIAVAERTRTWPLMREAGDSIDQVIGAFRSMVNRCARAGRCGDEKRRRLLLQQAGLAGFRRYVAGKLGMM